MKKIIFAISTVVLLAACGNTEQQATVENNTPAPGQETPSTHAEELKTTIEWISETNQQLGKVNEGQIVEIAYRFKNSGEKPLVIRNVSASCGCTVPEKPEEPIAPGKEGVIKAKFDSRGRPGMQNKNVFVDANIDGGQVQLSFAMEVMASAQ